MMKKLYLDIKSRLEALQSGPVEGPVPLINHVDLYSNQTEASGSIPGYPAVFIDFPYTCYKDSSAKIQLSEVTVRIILCVEKDTLDAEGLFDIKDRIYKTLQGGYLIDPMVPENQRKFYALLSRHSEHSIVKHEGVYAFEMNFHTTMKDFVKYGLTATGPVTVLLEKEIINQEELKTLLEGEE